MKKFFSYLHKRPLAFISLILLILLYLSMIFAEFLSPYLPTQTFEHNSFHPINISITKEGLVAKEAKVISKVDCSYAFIKGRTHKIDFFVHGNEYKLFGFIPCDVHLFGCKEYPVYILGSDNLGRDIFSRILYGSRISLTIGFVATLISLLLAIFFGGIAGFYGGKTDWFIMRGAEFLMLLPSLYLILFIRSLLNTKIDSGTSYIIITLILSFVGWPKSARTIRGIVHSIKSEDYVLNARLEGIPSIIIITKYIIPQIISLLIVSTMLSIPGFIMSETTLSYLGLGISDPSVSWGSMINREITSLDNLISFPNLLHPVWVLLITTFSFSFFGEALRDYFDPYHAIFSTWKRKNNNRKNQEKKANSSTKEEDAIIKVLNLSIDYLSMFSEKEDVHALKNVSYYVKKGEILGIVGESGSGKTACVTALPYLLPKNTRVSGQILFEGKDILKMKVEELRNIRGKKIAMVFQEPGSSFDPLQNISSAFYETYKNSDDKITKEESDSKAIKLLEEVGIKNAKERLKNYPHQFSGGQLQRISIALSLAQNCSVLIADEVTTSLDVTTQNQIINLLLKLKEERGLSIIFISHDINLVSNISDRIIVIHDGEIVEEGNTSSIINKPNHPYTKLLLSSFVKTNKEDEECEHER